ncbi:hypothetical protein [Oryzobacter telluris]|uniref:hypothetical protein n=1 Tax=Oryzobacter telluris TaxID=3149179 RepID=UPI00370D066B
MGDEVTGGDVAGAETPRRGRPRAAVAGAAIAALVAGGVGLATWVDRSGRPAPGTAPTDRAMGLTTPDAGPTPSDTATTSSPTPSPTAPPTVSASPSAPPPKTPTTVPVPWAAGSTVHLQSGTIGVGAGRQVRRFAPLASGGAVVATDPGSAGNLRWRIHDSRGRVVDDLGRPQQVEVSRDGRLLALQKGVDAPVTALDQRGRRLGTKDLGGAVVAVADGWVWTTSQTGTRGWQVSTGRVRTLTSRLTAVSADGRRGGATSFGKDGRSRCWRVVDLTRSSAPVLLERCGADNPEGFTPQEFSGNGRLVIGTDDADGGFYFRVVVARVADGRVLTGRSVQGERVDGWTWALAADARSILFSRNVAEPRFPASRNDLARCTLDLACTQVQEDVRLAGEVTQPRYVVGQPLLPAR